MQVQTYLYSHLATEFSAGTLGKTGLALHELVGVGQLLFILKEHYSLVGGARGDGEDRSKVRAYLILIIKEFITKVTKGMHDVLNVYVNFMTLFFLVQRNSQRRYGEYSGLPLYCTSCKGLFRFYFFEAINYW